MAWWSCSLIRALLFAPLNPKRSWRRLPAGKRKDWLAPRLQKRLMPRVLNVSGTSWPQFVQEESRDALVKLNEEFHQVILEYAQNRRLTLLLDTLQDIIRFRRQLAAYNPEYKGSIYRQHSAIADALEKGQRKSFPPLLQEHIQDSAASFCPRNPWQ